MTNFREQKCIKKMGKLFKALLYRVGLVQPRPLLFDVSGSERIVEYAWVLSNLNLAGGKILDVGCYGTLFPIMLAGLGYEVVGMDLKVPEYRHPNFTFIKGDILNPPACLLKQKFDVVSSVSAIEHVGLGDKKKIIEDGDIKAVKALKGLVKDEGSLFLTMGYGGRFQLHKSLSRPDLPLGRLYDEERIKKLCEGFELIQKEYFIKEKSGGWKPQPFEEAKRIIYPPAWNETISIICLKLKRRTA